MLDTQYYSVTVEQCLCLLPHIGSFLVVNLFRLIHSSNSKQYWNCFGWFVLSVFILFLLLYMNINATTDRQRSFLHVPKPQIKHFIYQHVLQYFIFISVARTRVVLLCAHLIIIRITIWYKWKEQASKYLMTLKFICSIKHKRKVVRWVKA